jgi:hypothetical protein
VGVQVPPPAQTVNGSPPRNHLGAPRTSDAGSRFRARPDSQPAPTHSARRLTAGPGRTDRADSQVVEIVLVQIASVEIVVLVEVVVLLEN